MMIGFAGMITLDWALFFSACVGLGILFFVIRKTVFYLSERFLGKK